MSRAKPESPLPPPKSPAELARLQALAEGERRRRAYLATLDPRQVEMLGLIDLKN